MCAGIDRAAGRFERRLKRHGSGKLSQMDEKFEAILKSLADKPARSCLEPYRELIEELRNRGWTYREIVANTE